MLLPLAILSQEMSALKKREKKRYEETKRASARNLERKEKVRQEVKMKKCPTVESEVQDTHLREKKNIEHLILLTSFKEQERYVSPQKSKSRIRLSPLFSPSSSHTIHSPHMHILI